MTILIAPASFKGSLSCVDVAMVIQQALYYRKTIKVPISDGGDGFLDAIKFFHRGLKSVKMKVVGPDWRKVMAEFCFDKKASIAFIEMSRASGLRLLPGHRRNPLIATTYGTGQLLKKAIDMGAKEIVIGIGGSATVDGGIGAITALGASFLDKKGDKILHAKDLCKLYKIDTTGMPQKTFDCRITIASDVTNPLLGKDGAAVVYGPQKGATRKMVKILQKGHERLAKVAKRQMGIDMQKISGGGAAGGLGAGLVCFLGADIKNGVDIIFELSNIEEKIKKSSLIITGEGCFDRTSLYGKAPFRIAKLASRYKKPCILICGKYDLPEAVEGVKYVRELRKFAPLIECLKNPRKYIKMAVRHLFNMLAEFN